MAMIDIIDRDNIKQARLSLYCYILDKHNTVIEDDVLKQIYLENTQDRQAAENPGALDMIAYLARSDKIKKPEDTDISDYYDVINLISMYRNLNRLIQLQNENDRSGKIRNPDDFILKQMERINGDIAKNFKIVNKEIHKFSLLRESYHPDTVKSAKQYLVSQENMDTTAPSTAQDFVDALRKNDFLKFTQITQFVLSKYRSIIPPEDMGADDLIPLLLHEFASTDINVNDMLNINLFSEMLSTRNLASGALSYSMLNMQFIPFMLALKQLDANAYAPKLEIRNKNDYDQLKEIDKIQAELQKKPECKEKIKQINYQATCCDSHGKKTQSTLKKPKDEYVNVDDFDIKKDKFISENKDRFCTSVILHLLQNVNINNIDAAIENYISNEFRPEFQRLLLNFELQNAINVRQWQMQLQHGQAITRNAHTREQDLIDKLPANYTEYLQKRHELARNPGYKYEHAMSQLFARASSTSVQNDDASWSAAIDKQPLDRVRKSIIKREVKLNPSELQTYAAMSSDNPIKQFHEKDFQVRIRPRLEAESRQIALKEAKREFKDDKNQITKELILNIQKLIESTDWNVTRLFGLGGKKIHFDRDGRDVTMIVPGNVYRIHQLCKSVNSPGADVQAIYKSIHARGKKASDSFSLFRHKETQGFYDTLKDNYDEQMERKNPKK